MENFITRASGVSWRVKYAQINPSATSDSAAATAHASHSWRSKRDVPVPSVTAGNAAVSSRAPEGLDKASSAKPRSPAD